jgi:hypothetical protein
MEANRPMPSCIADRRAFDEQFAILVLRAGFHGADAGAVARWAAALTDLQASCVDCEENDY